MISIPVFVLLIILIAAYIETRPIATVKEEQDENGKPSEISREIEIDPEGIMLADGYSMGFPADRVQEYSSTVINESGTDLKECYVVLDESARRVSEDDDWEMEQRKLVDAPFRWNKSGASRRMGLQSGPGRWAICSMQHFKCSTRLSAGTTTPLSVALYVEILDV